MLSWDSWPDAVIEAATGAQNSAASFCLFTSGNNQ